MPVVAMTHEMGSLARDVALELAAQLGLKSIQHEVGDLIAERMHVPKSLIRRLREGKAGLLEKFKVDEGSEAIFTAEEVLTIASEGDVVIRGWGATCLLRPVPHIPCVRVTRSVENRVRWLMENLDLDDPETALHEIRRSDRTHAARMHERFSVTWGDPVLYDLTLNTDRVSIESCVTQISHLLSRPEFQETPETRATLENMTLEAHVRAALRGDTATHEVRVTIVADGSSVTMKGIVVSQLERDAVKRVASAVPGVTEVDDQLKLMAGSKMFPSSKYS
ncbi:MAG: cytidylate kinase family protein [Burkholderiales bacterium]